ncbi:hypothetical protein, partial [Bacteroides heparinolyticus]|uniref:hypothetical protein n=1 Tax=Prevotella heparinolytica TaxID=28113 RepID=UPI0035A1321C
MNDYNQSFRILIDTRVRDKKRRKNGYNRIAIAFTFEGVFLKKEQVRFILPVVCIIFAVRKSP